MKEKTYLKVITIILVIGISLLSFKLINPKNSSNRSSLIKKTDSEVSVADKLTPKEFKEQINKAETFTIDVHTPEQKHIPGTDAFIPFDQIEQNISELPEDKNTPIAVYCRSGSMSEIAGKTLNKLGYTIIVDLEGGINNYKSTLPEEIIIQPDTQDLGTVIYGDVATTEFQFTNFTGKELKVTRVSTSCGCTKAKIDKDVLAPYETTKVKVSFDPAVHKDDTDLGELTRTIYLETNNTDYPKIESTITANVIKK